MTRLSIDGEHLSLHDVARVASRQVRVDLDEGARKRVAACRAALETMISRGEPIYGANTGFGLLSDVRIAPADIETLQANLIRSHCAGVGPPLPADVTRAMILLRANVLARGHSGVRPEILDALLGFLNADILPVIPSQGSVGASGDLAPLAHLALALMGEAPVVHDGVERTAAEAMERAGMRPVRLASREGLALVNGTQTMTAVGTLALLRAEALLTQADVAAAMTLDALLSSASPFDERIAALRPHPGHAMVAANVRRLLDTSGLLASHQGCGRVQDAYSLRCTPQVHGAARDAAAYARRILEVEVNAVTDNPIFYPDRGEALFGGNFHGQPVAQAMDVLSLALADAASIAERRLERILNPAFSGLPAFLARNPGLESGLMMAQVTAAALVSENKVLAHPASIDSIPTGAGKEDHVSMGVTAALKAARIVDHYESVVAIEVLAAAQGFDMRRPLRSSPALEAVHAAVRRRVPALDGDRALSSDIRAIAGMLRDGAIRLAAESILGGLQ